MRKNGRQQRKVFATACFCVILKQCKSKVREEYRDTKEQEEALL